LLVSPRSRQKGGCRGAALADARGHADAAQHRTGQGHRRHRLGERSLDGGDAVEVARRVLREAARPPAHPHLVGFDLRAHGQREVGAQLRDELLVVERCDPLLTRTPSRRAHDDAPVVAREVRPLRRRPRRRSEQQPFGARDEEPAAVELVAHTRAREGERDDRDGRVVDPEERAGRCGAVVFEQTRGLARGDREHGRVCVQVAERGHRRAEAHPDAARLECGEECVDDRAHAADGAEEHRPRRGGRLRSKRGEEVRAALRGSGELRCGGADAQVVGVARVDPAEQRVDEPLEHLVAELLAHERADRDVLVGPQRVRRGARRHRSAHDAGRSERVEVGGHAEHEPRRKAAERALAPHERAPGRRGHELAFDPELTAQVEAPGHAREEGVGALVDGASRKRRRVELAAGAVARLVDDDLDAVLGREVVRRGEAGDAAADDRDALHVARTRSASAANTVGSSLSMRVRANAMPRRCASAAASMSRS
jgi:hypothetical protein